MELTNEDKQRIEKKAYDIFYDSSVSAPVRKLITIAEYATLYERQQQKELETRIHELESIRNELVSNQLGHRLELKEIEKEFEAERSEVVSLLKEYANDTGAVDTNLKARVKMYLAEHKL